MPNVLHLRTVTGRGGGPEKTLLNSHRFIGDGYALQLAYIRPVGDRDYDLPERAAKAGAELIDIPERGGADPRTLLRLAAQIRRTRPALLHAHDYKTNLLSILLGRWFRIPVLTTLHGYALGGGRLDWYFRVDRWSLPRMDHIVVVSDDLASTLFGWGIERAKVSVVENAIDGEQFARRWPMDDAKARLGFRPDRLLIGAVGRLSPEKGFDRLICAVDRLVRGGCPVDLAIVGEGGERPRLESLIAELGVGERVRLLGHRTDAADLFQAMDVFALSSVCEGLPNVVLEALATEVPVVATRIAGVPSVIQHEQNGLLVEPDNVDQLAAALQTLLADRTLRCRLAKAGRKTVEERFSFAARMGRIRDLYDKLLAR